MDGVNSQKSLSKVNALPAYQNIVVKSGLVYVGSSLNLYGVFTMEFESMESSTRWFPNCFIDVIDASSSVRRRLELDTIVLLSITFPFSNSKSREILEWCFFFLYQLLLILCTWLLTNYVGQWFVRLLKPVDPREESKIFTKQYLSVIGYVATLYAISNMHW